MLGVTLHRNISQNLFFILIGSLVDFMECCNVFIKQKCNVSPYNFCKVLPYNLCKVLPYNLCKVLPYNLCKASPYIPKLGSLFSILLNNFINLTFTFLKLCIMFRLDDLVCLTSCIILMGHSHIVEVIVFFKPFQCSYHKSTH